MSEENTTIDESSIDKEDVKDELKKKTKRQREKKTIAHTDGRIMGSEEMERTGLLRELNRVYFHPLGIDVRPLKSGKCSSFVFIDMSDSVGNLKVEYPKDHKKTMAAVALLQTLQREMNGKRKRDAGYVTQPISE